MSVSIRFLSRFLPAMYICICKAVTDGQIRSAVEDGVTSLSGLRESLGCTGQCGKCGKHVKQIRDETLQDLYASGGGSVMTASSAT